MPRCFPDDADPDRFDPPFAEERCDTCGETFLVEVDQERAGLIECPACQAHRDRGLTLTHNRSVA